MNEICSCENLDELGLDTEFARQVLDALGEKFTFDHLRTAVDILKRAIPIQKLR